MKIRYGKRKYVPDSCPKCGAKNAGTPKSLADLLKQHYGGWNVELERDPFWGFPQWFGRCGQCSMIELISKDSIFTLMKKRA